MNVASTSPQPEAWLASSRQAWDARAARWDARAEANAHAPDRAADLDRIWQHLALSPGARLLDAGCGSGQYAVALAAQGAVVTGRDLSPQMIRIAKGHAAAAGLDLAWQVGDLAQLDAADDSFDAIHARVVLHCVPDVPAALITLRRVLRPGGRLLVSIPGARSPIYKESWRRHLPGGGLGSNYILPWELEALLRQAGWQVLEQWGEWGETYGGVANATPFHPESAPLPVQQATATTWTIIGM